MTAIEGGDEAPIDDAGADELFELYSKQEADDESPVTVTFTLPRDLDKRLDRYLVDRVPFLSRTSLQRLIRESAVTVNGRVPKPSTRLHRGDVVVAMLPPPPSNEIGADDIPLDVLHEDEHLIVVNKQADLVVHPARSIKRGTLINALAWHFLHSGSGTLSTVGGEIARPGVVHRLDRHTTGAIVAAKCDVAHWRLAKAFEARLVSKRYLALVHGLVEPATDLIDLPLGKHPTIRERYAVRWDETGKASRTVVHVIERYPLPTAGAASPAERTPGWSRSSRASVRAISAHTTIAIADGPCSLVELDLLTGRTHQIRVHLSHRGWPIVGDELYGGRALVGTAGETLIDRQALHASVLEFTHPISKAPMRFSAPLPEDFRRAVLFLRRRGAEFVDSPGARLDLAALGIPRAAVNGASLDGSRRAASG